ncbi:hypothetical protein JJJ17_19290 [Paracoccus caeni]|uniref:Uncharacterized protein n=1 Tax=Paracoccus caeni TaxID=657651 RepID=A0A934SI48_9RHOB|nr:hypothetical protein [Paracoccus caeni]MBK4218078.1 hypothetical protein [Paracoccus caeni]
MSDQKNARRAARQRQLEIEWTALCRRNRKLEAAFSVVGVIFLGLLAKFYWRPPQTMILLQICVFLIVLATLTILAFFMLFGAWREWRGYKMVADVAEHPGARPDAALREKWRLLKHFLREERP